MNTDISHISSKHIDDLNMIVQGFTHAFEIQLQKMGITGAPVLQLYVHNIPLEQMPQPVFLAYASKNVFLFSQKVEEVKS